MMMQGQLTIAAFDRETAALEEVGTLTGDLFDALAIGRREGLERRIGLAQRFKEVMTQRSPAVAVLGAGMASVPCGSTLRYSPVVYRTPFNANTLSGFGRYSVSVRP